MAKERTRSGRKSTTTAKSEVKETREGFIKGLVAVGMTNEELWSACETRFPQIIVSDKERRSMCDRLGLKPLPFDGTERERVGWAIRAVKGVAIKEDESLAGIQVEGGDAGAVSLDKFENLSRWNCGWPVLNWLFGETHFVHCTDAENSEYTSESQVGLDEKGSKIKKQIQVWKSGHWQKGDPMCYAHDKLIPIRDSSGELVKNISALQKNSQKVEIGLPYGYMGFVGGSPGVGKSRTAIDLSHSVTRLDEIVLYVNGEAAPAQFRSWCGAKVSDLFRVIHGDHKLIPFQTIEDNIFKYRPRLIIIDSVQTILEWNKGLSGQKRVLQRLGMIKSDPEMGNPHIMLISQLNKKLDLAGAKILEHLVDYSIKAFRREGHKGQFFLESMKMRGAECPRGALFKHMSHGVVCLNTDFADKPVYELEQRITSEPAIQAGVTLPEPKPETTELVEGDATE